MSMAILSGRPLRLIVSVALLLLAPCAANAQTSSFRDLALTVNLGDRLRIDDHSGSRTTGRLVDLRATELILETPSGQRRVGLDVSAIAVRRPRTRKAVLIGAGLGAVVGLLTACRRAEREECGDAALLLGAVGAGAGVVVSAVRPGWTTLQLSARASSEAASAGEPGPLDELALHVNLGDWLRVRRRSGTTVNGRLTRLSGHEIALAGESGDVLVGHTAISAVAVRRYALGRGALIGAVTFTALAFAAPACRDNPDCVPLAAAPFGAGVGVAIGALVPRMRTIFRAEDPTLAVGPALSPRGAGVRAVLRW